MDERLVRDPDAPEASAKPRPVREKRLKWSLSNFYAGRDIFASLRSRR